MRSQYCGSVEDSLTGSQVSLCGWVHRRRDHGGIIFIDLRDREGICQIVVEPDTSEAFALAEQCRSEYVLRATGKVRQRPEGMVNASMATGTLELVVQELEILARAETPAFPLDDYADPGEEIRMRHRYLDMRRPEMLGRLKLRAAALSSIRRSLEKEGFLEIETPQLVLATPEGARDYLVPSRVQPGNFFALAQSPQLYKQLLMIGGVDRYYQLARCFRDEDLRADRQPEFSQIDIEMAFVDREEVMALGERMMGSLLADLKGEEMGAIPRLTHAEALHRYGSDKPDLRNPLHLVEVSDLFVDEEFAVLREPAADPGSRVAVMRVPEGGSLTRSELDGYTELVRRQGSGGMAWIRVNEANAEGLQSPIVKFLSADCLRRLLSVTQAQAGDMLLFGAGGKAVVNASMDVLRRQIAEDRELLAEGYAFCWVEEFPMFERDQHGQLSACHHPFTGPLQPIQPGSLNEETLSSGYDMVLNGFEIGGGSIRIHDSDLQLQVLRQLGLEAEEAERKFGFLLRALRSGCPPHGGIAFGFDRIAMLLSGANNLRDVIAFPKTQSASCPLTGAPAPTEAETLAGLGIRLLPRAGG